MTPEETNRAVAEALGYALEPDCKYVWNDCNGKLVFSGRWTPATKVEHALDHIVPVLKGMGIQMNVCLNSDLGNDPYIYGHLDGKRVIFYGEGSCTSERIASALCEVLLKAKGRENNG